MPVLMLLVCILIGYGEHSTPHLHMLYCRIQSNAQGKRKASRTYRDVCGHHLSF